MVVITAGLFLFNLLCAMVPCDMRFRTPEIINQNDNDNYVIRGRSVDSNLLNNQIIVQNVRESEPIVETNIGRVQGYTMSVMSGKQIYAFEGIPFGESTGGPNRFKPPKPKRPWRGVRQAKAPGPICAQLHLVKLLMAKGSEDCLSLNIYTPNVPVGDEHPKIPVIIQIHGGSFIFGAGSEYGPSYLLSEQNVILITINFRQGILGFLSTGDLVCPGNNGLKDQALALRWVKENIYNFGGDPDRITLMGQSSGAVSVTLHLVSNVTRDYYSGAISLSGSPFLHWAINPAFRARDFAKKIAKGVNCPDSPSLAMVDCMRSKRHAQLSTAQMNLFEWFPFPMVLQGPVIEPDHPGAFLTEDPEAVYERGDVAKVPVIFSVMIEESYAGLYPLNLMMRYGQILTNPEKYLPILLDYSYLPMDSIKGKDIFDKMIRFYYGSTPITEITKQDFRHEMGTDRYFVTGIHQGIQAHAAIAPTYSYLFSFLSQYNIGAMLGLLPKEQGVSHGEDMFMYFNASGYSQGFKHSDPESELSQIMCNLVGNFAHKRIPYYTNKNGEDQVIWDANRDPFNIRFLEINNDIKMIDDPFANRVRFWEQVGLSDMKTLTYLYNNHTQHFIEFDNETTIDNY